MGRTKGTKDLWMAQQKNLVYQLVALGIVAREDLFELSSDGDYVLTNKGNPKAKANNDEFYKKLRNDYWPSWGAVWQQKAIKYLAENVRSTYLAWEAEALKSYKKKDWKAHRQARAAMYEEDHDSEEDDDEEVQVLAVKPPAKKKVPVAEVRFAEHNNDEATIASNVVSHYDPNDVFYDASSPPKPRRSAGDELAFHKAESAKKRALLESKENKKRSVEKLNAKFQPQMDRALSEVEKGNKTAASLANSAASIANSVQNMYDKEFKAIQEREDAKEELELSLIDTEQAQLRFDAENPQLEDEAEEDGKPKAVTWLQRLTGTTSNNSTQAGTTTPTPARNTRSRVGTPASTAGSLRAAAANGVGRQSRRRPTRASQRS